MDDLTKLGSGDTNYVFHAPHAGMLDKFTNPYPKKEYEITHETEEFTSLCPKTKQPDFARITIYYTPDVFCVETKSLKLYLFAYRNEGAFMEKIVNKILSDLVQVLSPRCIEVVGEFGIRGGIKTIVRSEYKNDQEADD